MSFVKFNACKQIYNALLVGIFTAVFSTAVSATPYLYETFGGQNGEIAALNLGVTTEYNAHSGNIGSVVAGGGKVYWTEGKNLWFANGDLSNASILHVNGLAPNGLALMLDVPPESVPEPASLLLVGVGLVGLVRSRRQKKSAVA